MVDWSGQVTTSYSPLYSCIQFLWWGKVMPDHSHRKLVHVNTHCCFDWFVIPNIVMTSLVDIILMYYFSLDTKKWRMKGKRESRSKMPVYSSKLNVDWYREQRLTCCFFFLRGVGFLKYFQVKQLPNFLLASPILSLALCTIIHYVKLWPEVFVSLGFRASSPNKERAASSIPLERGAGSKRMESRSDAGQGIAW